MDMNALFKLSYGLFVLSAKENGKDNTIFTQLSCSYSGR